MDKLSEKLCLCLRDLHTLAVEADMTSFLEGETAFLMALRKRGEDPITPSELSEELSVTKGRITAIVNSLIRKEMVRLEKMPGDGRKVNVRITDVGNKYIEDKLAWIEEFLNDFVARVGEETVETLSATLNRVCAIMSLKDKT